MTIMLDFDFNSDIDFSIDTSMESKTGLSVSRKAIVKYEKLITRSVRDLSEIANFDLLPGEQYRIITTKNMNALTAIYALMQNHEIEEIVIAIYRMNQPAVMKIIEIAETIPVWVLLSSFFRENKKYENWTRIIESKAKTMNNLNVSFAWSHAKITLIKTKCGKHIVFEGSGNLSDNARIEQYILENNEDAYKFHRAWIMEAMNGDSY